jgi:hypothetical protein
VNAKTKRLLEAATTEFDLMRILAPILAGRYCVVKIKDPATTGSYGTLQIRPDGVPEIHITPYLDHQSVRTLLHECAHIRLHADKMTPSNTHQAAARSITVTKEQKQQTLSWELQADTLRDHWLAYGKAHAPSGYSEDGGIMVALLDYYK